MNERVRLIIAFLIILILLMLYPSYLRWVSPPQAKPERPERTQTAGKIEDRVKNPERSAESREAPAKRSSASPKEELYDLTNRYLDVTFSNVGGSIKHLEAKTYAPLHKETATLVEVEKGLRGSSALVFPFEKAAGEDLVFQRDKSLESNGTVIAFSAVKGGALKISKVFELLSDQNAIALTVYFENLSDRPRTVEYEITTQMHFTDFETQGQDAASIEAGGRIARKIECHNYGHIAKKGFLKEGAVEWTFVSKKYFCLITDPKTVDLQRTRSVAISRNAIANYALMPSFELAPGGRGSHAFLLYAGPKEYKLLKSYRRDYETLFSKGFFGIFRIGLLIALQFFYQWLHNWGWAIIVITCLIKLVFTPLTHMSYESMKKMQVLQPKIKAIQEKYKKDPQKMNKEVMEFYKKHKVNPMSGCLPLLLQMPIFIAFYQVLYQAIELKGAPFIFWVKDLSAPDRLFTLPFSLPFIGDGINILPLVMVVSMVWQQKLTPSPSTSPEQAKIMTFMPIIFGFIFYNLPSGLVLYWTVNNFLTIFHQLFIKKYLPHPILEEK